MTFNRFCINFQTNILHRNEMTTIEKIKLLKKNPSASAIIDCIKNEKDDSVIYTAFKLACKADFNLNESFVCQIRDFVEQNFSNYMFFDLMILAANFVSQEFLLHLIANEKMYYLFVEYAKLIETDKLLTAKYYDINYTICLLPRFNFDQMNFFINRFILEGDVHFYNEIVRFLYTQDNVDLFSKRLIEQNDLSFLDYSYIIKKRNISLDLIKRSLKSDTKTNVFNAVLEHIKQYNIDISHLKLDNSIFENYVSVLRTHTLGFHLGFHLVKRIEAVLSFAPDWFVYTISLGPNTELAIKAIQQLECIEKNYSLFTVLSHHYDKNIVSMALTKLNLINESD